MERYEGNPGLVFLFGLTGVSLLGLIGFVFTQAAPQFATFTPLQAACGVFELVGMVAAGLFMLYSARQAGAYFVVDDEGIARHAWGRTTAIAWRDIVLLREINASGPKGKGNTPWRCVLHGEGGQRLAIPFRFMADGPRLCARLEPHLAPLRAADLRDLSQNGRRIRPGRVVGIVVLTVMVPMFLLAGLAALDPDLRKGIEQTLGMRVLAAIAIAGAPALAVLGAEHFSRELSVTPEGLALRSLFLNRSIPLARVASISVKVTDAEAPGTERATIRGDNGQKIAIESGMPGYRAILDLLHSRAGAKGKRFPTSNDPDF